MAGNIQSFIGGREVAEGAWPHFCFFEPNNVSLSSSFLMSSHITKSCSVLVHFESHFLVLF